MLEITIRTEQGTRTRSAVSCRSRYFIATRSIEHRHRYALTHIASGLKGADNLTLKAAKKLASVFEVLIGASEPTKVRARALSLPPELRAWLELWKETC